MKERSWKKKQLRVKNGIAAERHFQLSITFKGNYIWEICSADLFASLQTHHFLEKRYKTQEGQLSGFFFAVLMLLAFRYTEFDFFLNFFNANYVIFWCEFIAFT